MCSRDGPPSRLAENANSYPISSFAQAALRRTTFGKFREEVLR